MKKLRTEYLIVFISIELLSAMIAFIFYCIDKNSYIYFFEIVSIFNIIFAVTKYFLETARIKRNAELIHLIFDLKPKAKRK